MNNPMISVVMPVFNAEKYLDEAIESILNQTYKDFEFIIINDGSTDKSLKIIEKYKTQDERIVLISRENRGLIASLNEGIEKARGKYIARMDADDISLPQRFEKQVELVEIENLDICGGHYFLIQENSSINGLILTPRSHDMCILSLVSKVPFAHPSVMMRKSFLDEQELKYGQSEYKFAEDFDLWMRLFKESAVFGNIDDVILKYRVINSSLSKVNSISLSKDTKNLLKVFFIKNKDNLVNILNTLPQNLQNLNDEEKALVVRFVFKLFMHTFDFRVFKYLKNINKKIIICTVLSEFSNI